MKIDCIRTTAISSPHQRNNAMGILLNDIYEKLHIIWHGCFHNGLIGICVCVCNSNQSQIYSTWVQTLDDAMLEG